MIGLAGQEYPRFSDAEYSRRHQALAAVMAQHGVDHLLIVTDQRTGNAPQWVTGWPGTVEAFVIFRPGERMTMHVEWYNHVPLATRIARDVDVRWGEHRGIAKTAEELKRRGAKRLGIIGPLAYPKRKSLEESFEVVGLDSDYVKLRLIKSEEEIEWLRIGARFSDAGFKSLLQVTKPGLTERELANLVERAYVGQGGTTFIHYIGVTSMADPKLYVPPQFASSRKVQSGDVVFCELSACWWDYAGQVLRIESRGFTVCDDLMHGFGGGYFPPVVGTRSRPAGPLPQMTLEENMTVVVQPNVVTMDRKAGVQVGELIRVSKTGFERLHATPRGFFRAGQAI